ncbi:MFS transporter, partial [Nitratireductor sp. ZSWI3]|uniref:MFS transporter n=1 Tax=Nitratireductor sp. ZSWI3 TaxID=2966359 RepID=UPI0021502517
MPSRLLLPVLALAVFFVGATEFMIAPMLTPIAGAFATTPAAATWLISFYALSYAIGAPLIGLLAHRAERRRLLLAALLLLAADGGAVTLAPSLPVAIALRVFGGLAAAALIPAVFALIADHYPARDHSAAMGLAMLGMTA